MLVCSKPNHCFANFLKLSAAARQAQEMTPREKKQVVNQNADRGEEEEVDHVNVQHLHGYRIRWTVASLPSYSCLRPLGSLTQNQSHGDEEEHRCWTRAGVRLCVGAQVRTPEL